MSIRSMAWCLSLVWAAVQPAWAGRPLATDDAATADHRTCLLETWTERSRDARALVVAAACGIAPGVELGADYSRSRSSGDGGAGGRGGLALKWVPESLRTATPLGELNVGLKLGTAIERPAGESWQGSETGALVLATWVPADGWAMHANAGAARDRGSATTAALVNLALVWTPHDSAVLFAETLVNNRREVFGGRVNTVGARWWWVKDRFGLDLTAGREAGSGAGTLWTLGFGWYGWVF